MGCTPSSLGPVEFVIINSYGQGVHIEGKGKAEKWLTCGFRDSMMAGCHVGPKGRLCCDVDQDYTDISL